MLNFPGGFGFDKRRGGAIYQILHSFLEVITVFCKPPDLIVQSNMVAWVEGRYMKVYLRECVLVNINHPMIACVGKISFRNFSSKSYHDLIKSKLPTKAIRTIRFNNHRGSTL